MILDGFDVIGNSNKSGALTFRKEGHTIFFSPHLLPKEPKFVSVTSESYEQNVFTSYTRKFNDITKAIKFVNDNLEKSKNIIY